MAVVAALALIVAAPVPAHADSNGDQFLAKINDLRASKGLAALQADTALMAFAQNWSDHMAQAGTLSHNPALSSSPGAWTKAGENVGFGPDVDTIFAAFVASPKHYENMVDPSFTVIGIGVAVLSDGTMYTTDDFEARSATTSTVTRVAPTTTTTRPIPAPASVTTTTAPRPVVRRVVAPTEPRTTTSLAPSTTTAPATTSTTSAAAVSTSAPVQPPTTTAPPAPPPVPPVPVRITLSLEQLRGLDPVL
jgi:hypothetical protein